MNFHSTPLAGAYVIEPERHVDERGYFARTWCRNEFESHGLNPNLVQCNVSQNYRRGTVRGMHYQTAPHAEAKLVRCIRGGIFDAIIDLREDSPTYRQWTNVELTEENGMMLYIPEGVAHGFQTLQDNTQVFYQMSEVFHPRCSAGVRWNDPAFNIVWPLKVTMISPKDCEYPDFKAA